MVIFLFPINASRIATKPISLARIGCMTRTGAIGARQQGLLDALRGRLPEYSFSPPGSICGDAAPPGSSGNE